MIDIGVLALAGFGFVLGVEHALDADHVIAVSTMASRTRSVRKSARIGILWGIGHTLTLLIVGMLVLGLRLSIPQNVAILFEFFVGATLVVLGALALKSHALARIHAHMHRHKSKGHRHVHSHRLLDRHAHLHETHQKRSFFVGMVHGLAGSAALMLLVLTTVDSFIAGVAYILIFGTGSIVGMLLVSSLIGLPFALARAEAVGKKIEIAAGLLSIAFGLYLMYQSFLAL